MMLRALFMAALLLAGHAVSGCGDEPSRKTADVAWENARIIAVEVEGAPETQHYLLRGVAAVGFIASVRKHAEIGDGASEIQTHGGGMYMYAMGEDASPIVGAALRFQAEEGMGGKNDPDWDKGLFEGQRERYKAVSDLIEKSGERISRDQFRRYEEASAGRPSVRLYWRK